MGWRSSGGLSKKKASKQERHSLAHKGREGSQHEIEWHEDGALELEMKKCMHLPSSGGKKQIDDTD